MRFLLASTFAAVVAAIPRPETLTNPAPETPAQIAHDQATALTLSPTSNVKGKAFDRFVVIWLENTDASEAFADPNLQWLAKKGITLDQYYAVTHPSEPNYIAAVSGEYFGLDGDAFEVVPSNVSTIVDLLDDKGISWSEYQEDLPYSGYQGFQYLNSKGQNDYVRKHNPLVIYSSVTEDSNRLAKLKNFTLFYEDLKADSLPQWMFITPNMTDDGHDTNVTFAGKWARDFLTPLLTDSKFMKNTLVMLTFDEDETYPDQNKIMAILLGDAVPANLVGTTDSHYYNHYSGISTVEANWDLYTLGRWDVGANVFDFVADKTGDNVRNWDDENFGPFSSYYWNQSYPGILNSAHFAPEPVPNVHERRNGRTVLEKIKDVWEDKQDLTYYDTRLEVPDGLHPPVYPKPFSAY